MKKVKQVHKTKEQILAQLKANTEFKAKMSFVKEKFYPALCKASTSIDDATILLSGFNNVIMEKFLELMKEKKISDLGLESRLAAGNDKIDESKKLLALFSDMTVFQAKDYIEGMRNEIQLFLQEENKARPLSKLKVKWVDQI